MIFLKLQIGIYIFGFLIFIIVVPSTPSLSGNLETLLRSLFQETKVTNRKQNVACKFLPDFGL